MNVRQNIKNAIDGVDIESLVKASVRKGKIELDVEPKKSPQQSVVNESFVAEPKPFKQVSELVSQKTKDSHVELYKRYVEAVNGVSARLDTADNEIANSMHSDYRSLKLDETFNLNAVWLHELYFANCFDPHSNVYMDSKAYMRLERDFGTFEDWQKDFMACAMSAGNGWAISGYHMFLKRYINVMISNHSQDVMVGFYPLIVIDMHEHAYHRDYLTDKKSYLIAQMRELNWNTIEERFLKAEALNEVLK
jgi:Fe-Mn family superoxide dismutase